MENASWGTTRPGTEGTSGTPCGWGRGRTPQGGAAPRQGTAVPAARSGRRPHTVRARQRWPPPSSWPARDPGPQAPPHPEDTRSARQTALPPNCVPRCTMRDAGANGRSRRTPVPRKVRLAGHVAPGVTCHQNLYLSQRTRPLPEGSPAFRGAHPVWRSSLQGLRGQGPTGPPPGSPFRTELGKGLGIPASAQRSRGSRVGTWGAATETFPVPLATWGPAFPQ